VGAEEVEDPVPTLPPQAKSVIANSTLHAGNNFPVKRSLGRCSSIMSNRRTT
jgi:hypothetical protein